MSKLEFTYPKNVCFECNCCGLCCGDTEHKTRHILLLENEAEDISAHTCFPIEDFAVEIPGNTPYLYEMKKPQGKCFFLKSNKCAIYETRPLICRFYPFELKFNISKNSHVFSFTVECPAINREGRAVSKKDFEALFQLAEQRLL